MKHVSEFSRNGNDLYWKGTVLVYGQDGIEFDEPKWSGYNDMAWWGTYSKSCEVATCKSGRKYRINFSTREFEEVVDAPRE